MKKSEYVVAYNSNGFYKEFHSMHFVIAFDFACFEQCVGGEPCLMFDDGTVIMGCDNIPAVQFPQDVLDRLINGD